MQLQIQGAGDDAAKAWAQESKLLQRPSGESIEALLVAINPSGIELFALEVARIDRVRVNKYSQFLLCGDVILAQARNARAGIIVWI
jgi:hypothetical protein